METARLVEGVMCASIQTMRSQDELVCVMHAVLFDSLHDDTSLKIVATFSFNPEHASSTMLHIQPTYIYPTLLIHTNTCISINLFMISQFTYLPGFYTDHPSIHLHLC